MLCISRSTLTNHYGQQQFREPGAHWIGRILKSLLSLAFSRPGGVIVPGNVHGGFRVINDIRALSDRDIGPVAC
jgi:hypothetical protein